MFGLFSRSPAGKSGRILAGLIASSYNLKLLISMFLKIPTRMELFLDLMYMYNTYSFKIIGVFNWCN